ncbi:hypothetical protein [Streptomyces sp. NPDC018352]|uniref:hypothetical protein n=1 Tax=Streptomyces sp. NPDC018352 TaxID=3157194 RepID=UPI0033D92784
MLLRNVAGDGAGTTRRRQSGGVEAPAGGLNAPLGAGSCGRVVGVDQGGEVAPAHPAVAELDEEGIGAGSVLTDVGEELGGFLGELFGVVTG